VTPVSPAPVKLADLPSFRPPFKPKGIEPLANLLVLEHVGGQSKPSARKGRADRDAMKRHRPGNKGLRTKALSFCGACCLTADFLPGAPSFACRAKTWQDGN
jgi:hypothetical protein